jgi:hypothetical protein
MRAGFWTKFAAAAAIGVAANVAFFNQPWGATLGGFALLWTLALVATRPVMRHDGRALFAAALALGFGLVLFDNPTPLAFALFWIAVTVAVYLPRYVRFGDAWSWLNQLFFHTLVGLATPWLDLYRLHRLKARRPLARGRGVRLLALTALPLAGGAVFLTLFTAANPLIEEGLARLRLPEIDPVMAVLRFVFWGFVFTGLWMAFRPRKRAQLVVTAAPAAHRPLPGVSVASVTLSLAVFNLLFAVENVLDIAFLWSGAPLPKGVTLAEYAHRGAYPLIVTALLAGLFVLVALRPGSETAKVPLIRWLVALWTLQNLMLVASSILRTLDYVEVYSLTRFRIAALAWMVLVAVGLALIVWRMLRAHSLAWLINANTVAAGLVLTASTVVDLGETAAAWNVRHAKEVGGRGAEIDLCYLRSLGPAALVPLAELEQKPIGRKLKSEVSWLRAAVQQRVAKRQEHWRGWTWRNARRLAQARALPFSGPWPETAALKGGSCMFGRFEPPAPPYGTKPPAPTPAPAPPPDPAPRAGELTSRAQP